MLLPNTRLHSWRYNTTYRKPTNTWSSSPCFLHIVPPPCQYTMGGRDITATLLPWPVGVCINRWLETPVILGPSQRVPTWRTAPLGTCTASMDRVLELVGSVGGGLRSTALIWKIWAESSRPILTSQLLLWCAGKWPTLGGDPRDVRVRRQ